LSDHIDLPIETLVHTRLQADLLVFNQDRSSRIGLRPDNPEFADFPNPPGDSASDAEWSAWLHRLRAAQRDVERMGRGPVFIIGPETPRALVSIWTTNIDGSSTFLSTFYKEWTPDVDAATALLRAQENLRRSAKWRHPYYWAGWQLWGRP
jgi:hypothetical protein